MNSKFCVLLSALFVYVSGSPLFDVVPKIFVSVILIAGLIYYSLCTSHEVKFKKSDFFMLCLFVIILVLYGFIIDCGFKSYQGVGFFVSISLGFFLSGVVSRDEYSRSNEFLVGLTLVFGLPVYFVVNKYPNLLDYALSYTYGDFTHKTFVFNNFLFVEGEVVDRFVGFGSEPGVSLYFYLLSMYSRLTRNEGRLDLFLVLVLVAVYLSKSTFGIFGAAMLCLLKINFRYLLSFALILLIFFGDNLLDEFSFHFANKLIGSDSFSARYDRYYVYFFGDPLRLLFGYGNEYYSNVIAPSGFGGWDSILQVVQRYGLLGLVVLMFALFRANMEYGILIFVMTFMAFLTQSIWFLPAISYYYFKGFSRLWVDLKDAKNG